MTIADIERFAELSGDRFYAHMDEAQAARNPLFGGRVAHGYFLVSAAAGLFVDPPYGPVLGQLRDRRAAVHQAGQAGRPHQGAAHLQGEVVAAGAGYGEVRWDTEITNQNGEAVASYDVLTMVSEKAIPDARRRTCTLAAETRRARASKPLSPAPRPHRPARRLEAPRRGIVVMRASTAAPPTSTLHQHRAIASSVDFGRSVPGRALRTLREWTGWVARMTSRASSCRRTRAPGARRAG